MSDLRVVWKCERCGKFTSERTADKHRICQRIVDEQDSGYHWQYGVVQGVPEERRQ